MRQAGPDAAGIAVPALVGLLQQPRTAVVTRLATCCLLGWLGRDAAAVTGVLLDIAIGRGRGPCEASVRVEAARALVQIGDLSALAGTISEQSDREGLLAVLRHVGPDATEARRTLEAAWRQVPAAADARAEPTTATRTSSGEQVPEWAGEIRSALSAIQQQIEKQKPAAQVKDFYSTAEAAEVTNLSEWTVRDACNQGRINADKSSDGKWRIPRDEVVRIQNRGLPKKGGVE
jgi:excisionase family DNA binding protein